MRDTGRGFTLIFLLAYAFTVPVAFITVVHVARCQAELFSHLVGVVALINVDCMERNWVHWLATQPQKPLRPAGSHSNPC
jgi:hypothetical protein